MNKRKWLTLATILIFLFPLLDGLFSLSIFLRETAYAESNVSTIIERDEIKVTYSYEEDSVDDTYVNWKINYQHDVTNLDSRVLSAAIKFRLVTPLIENQYLDFTGSTFMDNQDGWYRQSEFTPTSEGSFLLRSPKDVPVSLIFQMDTMNLVDRVVEKEVTVEVEKEVEIPQEEIQTAIDEANTAIAEAEETGDDNQVAVAQAMAADIPTTRMEMVSETQIEEEIIQAEELTENILDSDTAKEYTLDFANYAEPEIVESTEISEASTVDSSSSETLETQTSSITEEQTSSSEEETLKTTETSVEETGNSSQEDAVASKDDDEGQEQAAVAVPFSAARRLRSASVDEDNPFDIKTEKRARLATKDADGLPISAEKAWNDRLYEIQLDVSSISIPGELSGDIIMYIDSSGSVNGGARKKIVTDKVAELAETIRNVNGQVNIAFLPTYDKTSEYPENSTTYYSSDSLVDLDGKPTELLTSIVATTMNFNGKKSFANPVEFADANGMLSRNPIGIVIVGDDINDHGDVDLLALAKHSAVIAALTDTSNRYNGKWDGLLAGSEYYFDSNSASGEAAVIDLALEKLREELFVGAFKVEDTISQYFSVIESSVNQSGTVDTDLDGNDVISYSNQEMVLEETSGRYVWSTSFIVKAKEDFIGGNVIPTNVTANSKVTAGNKPYLFDEIYNTDADPLTDPSVKPVTGIDTPYVNVKVFGGVVSSEETILLGERSPLTETDIKNGWATDQELLASYRNADGTFKYDVQPSIVFGNELDPLYNADTIAPTIAGSTDYASTGELIAGTKEGGNAAANYVLDYGTVPSGSIPIATGNKANINGTHTLTVKDTSLTIKKLLDNDELPADFSATFTIERTSGLIINDPTPDNGIEVSGSSDGQSGGTFGKLGVGEYEITETLPESLEGIKQPAVLSVVVSRKDNTPSFKFSITKKGLNHIDENIVNNQPYIINNETKGINLNILKKEAGTSNPINGVVFTLTKVGETVGTDYTTQDNGNISIEPGVLVAGNSYTLVEKTPATGFLPHGTTYTITVDTLGNVSVTGGSDGNVETNYNDDDTTVVDLTVFNNRKGVLPSTGGPGRQMFSVIALILMLSVAGISVIYVHRNRKGGA